MGLSSIAQTIFSTDRRHFGLGRGWGHLPSTVREVPMGVGVLVLHGLSSVLAIGVFVVTVHVAHAIPGPSMISALVIAAVSCFLSGLCYAELEAKVPLTGQSRFDVDEPDMDSELMHRLLAQVAGEFPASVVAWVLALHYLATLAVSARVIGTALVFVAGGPNPSACSVEVVAVIVIGLAVTVGVASIAWSEARSILACVLAVVATIAFLLVGFPSIDARNWAAHSYLTHGSSGLLSGAAVCTTAFFSHPAISVHGRRRRRSIPLAAGLTLTACFLTYLSVATILTLTTVHEVANTDLYMPQSVHGETHWTQKVLAILEIPCLVLSLLGTVQSLKGCAIGLSTKAPLCGCLAKNPSGRWVLPSVAGCLACGLIFLLHTATMLQLMALPPLFSNTLVCLCTLHARYQPEASLEDPYAYRPLVSAKDPEGRKPSAGKPLITITRRRLFPLVSSEALERQRAQFDDEDEDPEEDYDEDTDEEGTDTDIDAVFEEYVEKLKVATMTSKGLVMRGSTVTQLPTASSGRRATICVAAFCLTSCCVAALLVAGAPGPLSAVPIGVLTTVAVLLLVGIARMPQSQSPEQYGEGPFRVPLVPWQPAIAVFVSMCLAVDTLKLCWMPFTLWVLVGLVVYAVCVLTRERYVPQPPVERICLPSLTPPPHALVASLIPVHRESMEQEDQMLISH